MTYPLPTKLSRRVDDFFVKDLLGEGSLSTVHLAVDRITKRRLALKIFDRSALRSNKKDADVTMEEHCLRRLNHPGVAKLFASFRDGHAAYLVVELCPGGELWAIVKDVGCSDRCARHYFAQIIEAVSYLRDAQIVHRDIKAENVMIGEEGNAKLIDFGSAKDLANPNVKGAGTVSFKKVQWDNVGTPNFMAPEVIRNKFSDFRSDIWSLGCTIFQVITGMPPFGGGDICRVYKLALAARLSYPSSINADARNLISRMVVRDPNDRLGGADIRELRAHQYFASFPARKLGSRFEGAHCRAAPVLSLEESCLRAIGRRWAQVGQSMPAWVKANHGQLRNEAQTVLSQFAEVDAILHPAEKSPSSSDQEDGSAGPRG